MSIDWKKPIRCKYTLEEGVDIGPHPDRDDRRFVLYSGGHYGHEAVRDLENVPEGAGREAGWYCVDLGGGQTIAYTRNGYWYSDDDDCENSNVWVLPPKFVGSRVYLDTEFRPADKCPPPMDGTTFELEGCLGTYTLGQAVSGALEIASAGSRRSAFDWLTGKRWRPIQ